MRWAVPIGGPMGVLLVLTLVAGPVSAHPDNGTNVTELQQRIKTLEQKNAELEQKLVTRKGRIQKLEYRLNQTGKGNQFSDWMKAEMREIGAWNPYDDKPAWMIVLNDRVIYFVGKGNGQHSPNGKRAWATWITFEEAGTTNATLPYGPDDMKKEWTFKTGFKHTDTVTKIKQLVARVNSPATWDNAYRYTNDRLHAKKTTFKGTIGFLLGGFMLVFLLGMWVNRGPEGGLDSRIERWRGAVQEAELTNQSLRKVLLRR